MPKHYLVQPDRHGQMMMWWEITRALLEIFEFCRLQGCWSGEEFDEVEVSANN
jgi:hypothetical protein